MKKRNCHFKKQINDLIISEKSRSVQLNYVHCLKNFCQVKECLSKNHPFHWFDTSSIRKPKPFRSIVVLEKSILVNYVLVLVLLTINSMFECLIEIYLFYFSEDWSLKNAAIFFYFYFVPCWFNWMYSTCFNMLGYEWALRKFKGKFFSIGSRNHKKGIFWYNNWWQANRKNCCWLVWKRCTEDNRELCSTCCWYNGLRLQGLNISPCYQEFYDTR